MINIDEILSNYLGLFGVIYAFIFAVLYEMCADRVLSFIPKYKLEKWNESWKNILIRYSESDIRTNYRWLCTLLFILLFGGGILGSLGFKMLVNYILIMIFIIVFLLIARKILIFSCNHLFSFSSRYVLFIVLIVITCIFSLYPSSNFYEIDQHIVEKYTFGIMIGVQTLIFLCMIFFGLIYAIIPGSKIFAKLLARKEKVAEYCLSYVFLVLLTTLISIGTNKFINYIWQSACELFRNYKIYYCV